MRFGLGGQASYTWTRSAFRTSFFSEFPQFGAVEAGDALPYVPVHQGAATIWADHPRGQLAFTATVRSEMRDLAGQGPIPRAERIPGSVLLDASGSVNVTAEVAAYVSVTNDANTVVVESFRPFGARPAAPLQATAGVKVSGL